MMPEQPRATTPHDTAANHPVAGSADDFIRDAAKAVLQGPGVLRLEPRLKDVIGRVDPTHLFTPPQPKAPEGISIDTFGSITDVTVDITISSTHQALATAIQAEKTLETLLRNHNREPGRVVINILAIEHQQ